MVKIIVLLTLILLLFSLTAGDNDMLQDVCVADLNSSVKINGYPCTAEIRADDFSFVGIAKGELDYNRMGASVIDVRVEKFSGLNTLGLSMFHVDLTPGAIVPLHSHPQASEMAFVIQGQVDVGFIMATSNKHIAKTLLEKHVFVIPKGLVHYFINKGDSPATFLTAFNSQSPDSSFVVPALFAANPPLPDDVFAANFNLTTTRG